MKNLELLIDKFKVQSQNGKAQDEDEECYGIQKAMVPDDENHSSDQGTTHTLVLKSSTPFKLSHFALGITKQCSSPLRTGILVVSDEPIDERKLECINAPKLNAKSQLEATGIPQALVFETDSESKELELEILEIGQAKWWSGTQLTIKFIDAWGENTYVDLGKIGPIGTMDLKMNEAKIGPIAYKFNVTKGPKEIIEDKLAKFNREFKNLETKLKKKEDLTKEQEKYQSTRESLDNLNANKLDDLEQVMAQLNVLKLEYETLKGTFDQLDDLFGDNKDFICVNKEGDRKKIKEVIEGKTHVLIYFSAQYCDPCDGFNPKLIEGYEKAKEFNPNFEVIFVSSDDDKGAFRSQMSDMPWWAMDQYERELKDIVAEKQQCSGIPMLVCLKSDGTIIDQHYHGKVTSNLNEYLSNLK